LTEAHAEFTVNEIPEPPAVLNQRRTVQTELSSHTGGKHRIYFRTIILAERISGRELRHEKYYCEYDKDENRGIEDSSQGESHHIGEVFPPGTAGGLFEVPVQRLCNHRMPVGMGLFHPAYSACMRSID